MEGVQQSDPLGTSLVDSALQLVLVTVQHRLHSFDHLMSIGANLGDASVTGSPLGISATLEDITPLVADITELAAEINLELNTRKCVWYPGLRPDGISVSVHSLLYYLCVVLKA